jgi:hypothetical protein
MSLPLAVETSQLLEVLWVSLLAGVGVTACFAVVVLTSARSAEARRAGNGGAALGYAAAATVAFLVYAAVVVIGVRTMLAK